MKRVLIVEDEPDVRMGLRTVLEAEGFEVIEAENGIDGLAAARTENPDLLILDLMMPQLDGFQVCRELRAAGLTTPVLILSARSGELDKVLGFELGADDYVTKPFSVPELLARAKALLRRPELESSQSGEVRIGDAVVDTKACVVKRGHEEFDLFHYELEILKLLASREGQVVSRTDILNHVWGKESYPTTRTVDFHVCNLRKKIEPDAAKPSYLQTVHGIGYRMRF